jgi:integrase
MPFFVCRYYGSKASTKLVAIQDDVIIDSKNKTFKIKLRRSKTDQDGIGRWLHLSDITQQALLNWIDTSNIKSGKLFRGIKRGDRIIETLSCAQVNRIYKSIAARSCVDDSVVRLISGHSMRVGAAQDLLVSGASLPMIMQRGRWSKTDTVMRYIENTAF